MLRRWSSLAAFGLGFALVGLLAPAASAQVSCTGLPAFANCTAYALGASVTYNGSKYTVTGAAINTTRDCPPNSPFTPATDNWWTNNGACSAGATPTATATATRTNTPTATTVRATATATTARATATATTARATATATTARATATATTARATATFTSTATATPTTATATSTRTNTPTATSTPTPTATTGGTGCQPAWVAATQYGGNSLVSRTCSGVTNNYTAAYWSQGADPCTNSVPNTGDEWIKGALCGSNPTATATATATTSGTVTATPTNAPSGPRRYVAYSSTWNTSIYDLTTANVPSYITHINLAFARPDTAYVKGSYEFDQAIAGFEFYEGALTSGGLQKKFTAQQKTDLRNNIAALKARGTKVFVSVGGWSYSQGDQWSHFNAPHVVDLALDLGATGVDIDWESSTSTCTKSPGAISCTKDGEIANIISTLYTNRQGLEISIAGWSTGAYYIIGSPFEEGKVQWGSPFGGTMYNLVKNHGSKLTFINLMSYDGGEYYDPREGYESYRAIYAGPINIGIEIAPEGAGGAVLKMNRTAGLAYDQDMMTGTNNIATAYYNVQTAVDYVRGKGKPGDGMMIWQMWKERVHAPAPAGAASVNTAGQYICQNLPLTGNCGDAVPALAKLTP